MDEVDSFIKMIKRKNIKGINRRLDELGRVVIPIEYRTGKLIEGKNKVVIHRINKYVIVEVLEDQSVDTKRKIDDLGRVVINIETREELNWQEKDYISVWNYKNYIILKKIEDKCIFCNNETNLTNYREKLICNRCKRELAS